MRSNIGSRSGGFSPATWFSTADAQALRNMLAFECWNQLLVPQGPAQHTLSLETGTLLDKAWSRAGGQVPLLRPLDSSVFLFTPRLLLSMCSTSE